MFLIDALSKLLKSKAGAILGIIAIVAIGYMLIGKVGRSTAGWLWWALLVVLALAIVVAALWFLARYREKRFLDRLRAEEDSGANGGMGRAHRQLREKMLEAIRTLENSPDLRKKGDLPLYALPWYLLIGPSQSGKTTLLQGAANLLFPSARSSSLAASPTQNCDWRLFNTAVVLDTAGRYAFPVDEARDTAEWTRLLTLLRHSRELQPIDGLIISVAANTLASKSQEELRLDAAVLRKRIAEVRQELKVDFPVYLLITQCDLIEGFTDFLGGLPEPMLKQVFGCVNELREAAGDLQHAALTERFESMFASMVERLQQLRLALLKEKLPSPALRQKIFCFPEEFRALQEPLSVFMETLFSASPFQRIPFFRGIFFCSAQQRGTPFSLLRDRLHLNGHLRSLEGGNTPYFLHDLFATILPRDRYLVRPTKETSRWRLLKRVLGFSGCIALCLLLVVLLTQAFVSDRKIRSFASTGPCEAVDEPKGTEPLLDQAENCRQAVQALIDQNLQRSTWSRLAFDRSGRLEGWMRQRYVEKFQAEVLTPLDGRIDRRLGAASDTIPLVVLLVKRIELINRCSSLGACPDPIDGDMRPDYRLMLDPVGQQPLPTQVARLQDTYETYLRWAIGSENVLRREQEAHGDRLQRWFSSRQFAPRQILFWADQNYTPVTYQEFWEVPFPMGMKRTLQVEGAYTRAAWEKTIHPFLQRARDAVPELEPLLKEFKEEYRAQYFAQWRRFLIEFPRAELPAGRTREDRRRLVLKLLDASSPYNRALDVAFEQLKPLLPAILAMEAPTTKAVGMKPTEKATHLVLKGWQFISQLWTQKESGEEGGGAIPLPNSQESAPAWIHTLHRYIRSETRKTYLDSLKQIGEQWGGDASRENSFKLAQAGFQERIASEKSTQPVLKAWWIIGHLREKEGAGEKTEGDFLWPLLQRPVLVAWKTILEEAGEFLQKSWAESVVASTAGFSEMERLEFLYGSQGKVREFVNQFMKPFLADNETRFGQLLGEEVPAPPGLLKSLRDEKQFKPALELGGGAPHQVKVQATGESFIDSHTNLTEDKTEFLLACAEKLFKVTNRPKDLAEASATIFWSSKSCGDVVINIFASCERSCVARAASVGISVPPVSSLLITKRYRGQNAFLRFIQDFSSGSREFGINEFADSHPPSEWQKLEDALRKYRINAIRVFYQVDPPPALSKLLLLAPGLAAPSATTK